MNNLIQRAEKFKAMHENGSLFVMPCAWDAFSTLIFQNAGFSCIGTTSGGVNWVRGKKDYVYNIPKAVMLSAYGEIAQSTQLPVSADLENGYGEGIEEVADTILKSIDVGLVGGSIEDQQIVPSGNQSANGALYDLDVAISRIQAARSAADSSDIPFTITARCEVYYTDSEQPFHVAVERLNAFREAGADCLFVPGLNDLSQLAQLVKEVNGPISFGMGATPTPITLNMLEDAGIIRVSTGGGLTRAVFSMVEKSAYEIMHSGSFSYLNEAMSESDINNVLQASEES